MPNSVCLECESVVLILINLELSVAICFLIFIIYLFLGGMRTFTAIHS